MLIAREGWNPSTKDVESRDSDDDDENDGGRRGGLWEGAVGGARVFREKEKRGSSARVSWCNRWLNSAVKQLASGARGGVASGEEVEGRVKKVGLREVQSRDRGSSALRPSPSLSPSFLSLRSRNMNRELIVRIISRVAFATYTTARGKSDESRLAEKGSTIR